MTFDLFSTYLRTLLVTFHISATGSGPNSGSTSSRLRSSRRQERSMWWVTIEKCEVSKYFCWLMHSSLSILLFCCHVQYIYHKRLLLNWLKIDNIILQCSTPWLKLHSEFLRRKYYSLSIFSASSNFTVWVGGLFKPSWFEWWFKSVHKMSLSWRITCRSLMSFKISSLE